MKGLLNTLGLSLLCHRFQIIVSSIFVQDMVQHAWKRRLTRLLVLTNCKIFLCICLVQLGERGINLSGGQKQRVQLAKALHQDADIYLLDDPFSAVDAHTGSDLFKDYILTALASKTVIFVTHQVEFLPSADMILVFKEGRIIQAGKYADLLTFRLSMRPYRAAIKILSQTLILLHSHSSNDVTEGNFSEDDSQGAGRPGAGDGVSGSSSDDTD